MEVCERTPLRGYQRVLAEAVTNSPGNHVVVLPTGAGKTLVSIEVAFTALAAFPSSTVVYLAPTIALANQQCNEFETEAARRRLSFPRLVDKLIGRKRGTAPLGVEGYSAMFATPAKFQHVLEARSTSRKPFAGISLLVLDECHHLTAVQREGKKKHREQSRHPYAIIAELYRQHAGTNRPKILGLTASPGGTRVSAIDSLCGSIEASLQHIGPESQHRQLLRTVTPAPALHRELVLCDRLLSSLLSVAAVAVQMLQRRMSKVSITERMQLGTKLKFVQELAARARCIGWCGADHDLLVGTRNITLMYSDDGPQGSTRRVLAAWNALGGVTAIRKQEEVSNVRKLRKLTSDGPPMRVSQASPAVELEDSDAGESDLPDTDTDEDEIVPTYTARERTVLATDAWSMGLSPFFLRLLQVLEESHRKLSNASFRGVIFVQTRRLARDLHRVLENLQNCRPKQPALSWVKPTILLGRGNQNDDGVRFTAARQLDVLRAFRDGATNVMIATSVAEEGIDIQVCSLVVRLDPPATVIEMIQSRGRARYPQSDYFVFCSDELEKNSIDEIVKAEQSMLHSLAEFSNAKAITPAVTCWDAPDYMSADLRPVSMSSGAGASKRELAVPNSMSHLVHMSGPTEAALDAKSKLSLYWQQCVKSSSKVVCSYRIVSQTGPSHNPRFISEVCLLGKTYRGKESCRRLGSEQSAAACALEAFAGGSKPMTVSAPAGTRTTSNTSGLASSSSRWNRARPCPLVAESASPVAVADSARPAALAAPSSGSLSGADFLKALRELVDLKEKGFLTETEFHDAKKKLLKD